MFKKITSIVMAFAIVIAGVTYTPRTVEAGVNSGNGNGGWKLVWSDEFDQAVGGGVDTSTWNYDIGHGSDGWGNKELQYYTDSTNNVSIQNVDGATDGKALMIKAQREGGQITSGRLNSQGKFYARYGRMEARIKMVNGMRNGVWPAFWMMGNDSPWVGWPNCGELDIMEHRNTEREIISTLHWNPIDNNAWYEHGWTGSELNGQFGYVNTMDEWHTFRCDWYENEIQFFLDGQWYETIGLGANMEEFQKEHYFLLNLATGSTASPFTKGITVDGDWQSSIMYVDYVRVYQGTDGAFQRNKTNRDGGGDEPVTQPPIQDDGFKECVRDGETNVGDWNYYVGSWAGASARYQGGGLNDFAMKITENGGGDWGIQAFTERGVTPGHKYRYSITLNSDRGGRNVLLKDDVKTDSAPDGRDLSSLGLQQGDNVFSGEYIPETDRIRFFFKLSELEAGTTVRVTNVTLDDITSQGGGDQPPVTDPPQQTTQPPQGKPDVPKPDNWSVVENSNNAYEYANADNMEVVNVQHPDWAREDGVYVTTSEGIGYVTINGNRVGDDRVAVNGAGTVIYLSILNSERTEVVYYRNDGSYLGSVDIKKKAGTVVEPDTPEPTNTPENPTETPTLPEGGDFSEVVNSNGVYKYANASNMEVVNVQKPGFAKEDGIYMSTSEGIGYITINGTKVGEESVAIDGAGAVIYLSALNNKKSQIIYYRNDGSYLGSVDIQKGSEPSTPEQPSSSEPTTEKPSDSEQPTEPPTQEPDTTQPAEITISNDINITGYQMTAFLHNIEGNMGFRVVYQAEPTIEGQTATEIGLVYGIAYGNNPISEKDVLYGSNSAYVKSYAATDVGVLKEKFGESKTATYYARTMSCGVADGSNNISTKAYTTQYYVRAYAKLSDGRIVYSNVKPYKVYDIADYVYQNHKVSNEATYDYLYTRILKYVNSSYQKGDYNWNNVIVK